jgi:hypothetical protein
LKVAIIDGVEMMPPKAAVLNIRFAARAHECGSCQDPMRDGNRRLFAAAV